jgi:hypothetical protein
MGNDFQGANVGKNDGNTLLKYEMGNTSERVKYISLPFSGRI